jgi:hypothetical protein
MDALSNGSLLRAPEPRAQPINAGPRYNPWRYDRYDWSRFDPKIYGYEVIRPSSKKYDFFTVVNLRDYKRLSKFKWKLRVEHAKNKHGELTDTITRVDVLRSFMHKGKHYTKYMAREITGAGAGVDAEHKGGETLDNRRCRLRCTKRSENNHNWTHRPRPKYPELKRGVEYGDELHQTVRGIIWWTTVNGDRKSKRSPRMPYTPENVETCHQWWATERDKLYGHKKWAVGGRPAKPLVFPPLKGDDPNAPPF